MFDLFGIIKKEQNSKNIAKDRLKMVLVNDRTNCSPELLELLKSDILASISDYVDYDLTAMDIKITKATNESNGKPVLVANIPLKSMKRQ